eukprot:TRINITY_DN9257_c0_g1_i1.p1 TRINITY_DN9257_c0_g1~~TRINITY_DN9257_c0_g1_i1.p1  ORF type:complete len:184 (+),score=63.73 TRINITY_DN9257_c0_g1_i1:54-605(+)
MPPPAGCAERRAAEAALKKYGYDDADARLISAGEIAALREGGVAVVVVDVRPPAETDVSRIEGAVLQCDFEAQGGCAAYPADAVIVPACTVGFRSGMYCRDLLAHTPPPAQRVRNSEGILLHAFDGGRLVTPDGRATTEVHTYTAAFAHVPPSHTAVYAKAGVLASVKLGLKAVRQWCRGLGS